MARKPRKKTAAGAAVPLVPIPIAGRARTPGWEERLADMLARRRHIPFAWGLQDCSTLAADLVVTMTGRQPLADLLGGYGTEEEAQALLEAQGGIEAATVARMTAVGIGEVAARFAQRGDLALVTIGNETPLGIVIGTTVAIAGPDGLAFVPRRLILRAWAL